MGFPVRQHILDLRQNSDRLNEQVMEILDLYNIPRLGLAATYKLNKRGQKELIDNPTWAFSDIKWLEFFRDKGFWIDSYTSYASVYAGGQNILIFHYNKQVPDAG